MNENHKLQTTGELADFLQTLPRNTRILISGSITDKTPTLAESLIYDPSHKLLTFWSDVFTLD
jgi:hypothetical protein